MENKTFGWLKEDCINPKTGEILGVAGQAVTDTWLDSLPTDHEIIFEIQPIKV